jgi:hypothetical protein
MSGLVAYNLLPSRPTNYPRCSPWQTVSSERRPTGYEPPEAVVSASRSDTFLVARRGPLTDSILVGAGDLLLCDVFDRELQLESILAPCCPVRSKPAVHRAFETVPVEHFPVLWLCFPFSFEQLKCEWLAVREEAVVKAFTGLSESRPVANRSQHGSVGIVRNGDPRP